MFVRGKVLSELHKPTETKRKSIKFTDQMNIQTNLLVDIHVHLKKRWLKKLPKIDQPLMLSNGYTGLKNATKESVTDGIRLHG